MNIFLSTLERHFSQLAISNGKNRTVKIAQSYKLISFSYQKHETNERIFNLNSILQKTPWQLPSKQKPMVFTFLGINREPIRVPGLLIHEVLEKFDPLPAFQIPLEAPPRWPVIEKFAGPRMLKIRRHKMLKHKRRKRFDRDYFKYQKYHRQKKAKAEKLFRTRMQNMLDEYKAFDPEKYIKDIIARAKRDVTKDVAPSGRQKHPHWSTLVTLEELYGLRQTDYIDKKAGLAGAEDREKIRQLKKEYDEKYRGFLSRTDTTADRLKMSSDEAQTAQLAVKADDRDGNPEKPTVAGDRAKLPGDDVDVNTDDSKS